MSNEVLAIGSRSRLEHVAMRLNRKVHALAQHVIDTGVLPDA